MKERTRTIKNIEDDMAYIQNLQRYYREGDESVSAKLLKNRYEDLLLEKKGTKKITRRIKCP